MTTATHPEGVSILAAPCTGRHEVKRSIFQAFAEPLAHPAQAKDLLAHHHDADARHHCWAWRCDGEYRFSDDGEPAGTAGRPMLQAIEGAGIERVLVVVRRYFGGIKLGAGGLVRAYSAATSGCLQQAERRRLVPHVQVMLTAPFEHVQTLFAILGDRIQTAPEHSSAGATVTVEIPVDRAEEVLAQLRNQTRGQISIRRGGIALA